MPIISLAKQIAKTPENKPYWHKKDHAVGKRISYPRIPGWAKIRASVFKRDGYLCVICRDNGYTTAALVVDHIIPQAKGGGHNLENLQSLCKKCHDIKTISDTRDGNIKNAWDD